MLAACHHDGRESTRGARDDEAGAAPEEVFTPRFYEPPIGRERNRAGNQARVDEKVGRDGTDERLRPGGHVEGGRGPAQPSVHHTGRHHRDHDGGRAENGAIQRVRLLGFVRALYADAHCRDDDGVLAAEQQQRHQVGGIRHRKRRPADERDGKVHLPRGRQGRADQEDDKHQWLRVRPREERHERHRTDRYDGCDIQPYGR